MYRYIKEFVNFVGSSENQEEYWTKITRSEYLKIKKGKREYFSDDDIEYLDDICYYSDNRHSQPTIDKHSRSMKRDIVSNSSVGRVHEIVIESNSRNKDQVDYLEKDNINYIYKCTISKREDEWYVIKDSRYSRIHDGRSYHAEKTDWVNYYKVDQWEALLEFLLNLSIT